MRWYLAFGVALAYLLPALACLDDYGPTYDAVKGDYPYGERLLGYLETRDARFLDLEQREPVPEVRAPHPDFDVGRWPSHSVFPVGALLSALSCRVLWTELAWLPAMSAHHLPTVLLAAGLIFVVSAFACARWGALAGLVAGGSLALTPSFFGHSFNNPKDVPECVFYTAAVLAGFRALESGGRRAWWLAGAATGLALAQKANALFLPVQLLVFVGGLALYARVRRERGPRLDARGLLGAALAFVLTYYAVSPAFWSAPLAGPRLWLGQMLRTGNPALREHSEVAARISFDAPLAVLETTPLATLALALLGLAWTRMDLRLRWFLLVSALLPVARNLVPGMRSFDGTRHFLEFLPMLCLLAGAGAVGCVEALRRRLPGVGGRWPSALVALAALAPSGWAVVSTHPNQTAYFNALAGGLGGAQARHAGDAGDYWGNSYWQGMAWLSAEAEPGARLFVPFKDFIARAGAPVRLRADIRLQGGWRVGADELPLHVMHLVGKGGGRFTNALDREDAPVHEIRVQNGVVLHIHRLARDARGAALMAEWRGEFERLTLRGQVLAYLDEDSSRKAAVLAVLRARLPAAERLARLRPLLPAELLERVAGASDEPDELAR